ncbi:hypothetical protein [Caulobacter sp. D5]|uniref:hypothetical protein n=1 Tax=Caulobacter sp. D5 TaxID=357400 RepID=UPI0011B406EB|nr:hypothetical protein [Caulobacter sp. D5]
MAGFRVLILLLSFIRNIAFIAVYIPFLIVVDVLNLILGFRFFAGISSVLEEFRYLRSSLDYESEDYSILSLFLLAASNAVADGKRLRRSIIERFIYRIESYVDGSIPERVTFLISRLFNYIRKSEKSSQYISEFYAKRRGIQIFLVALMGAVSFAVLLRLGYFSYANYIGIGCVICLADYFLLLFRVIRGSFGANPIEAKELVEFLLREKGGDLPPGSGGLRPLVEGELEATLDALAVGVRA